MFPQKHMLFGQCLVERGVISQCQLEEALLKQRMLEDPLKLGKVLWRLGYITKSHISRGLADQFGVPVVELSGREIPVGICRLVDIEVAQIYRVIPLAEEDGKVILAIANPLNVTALDNVERLIGRRIEAVVATPTEISAALSKYYGIQEEGETRGCFVVPDPDGL